MTKVLVILQEPGEYPTNLIALVPQEILSKYDLDGIDGKTINVDHDLDPKLAGQIMELFMRFGLEESRTVAPDLTQYLNPKPPITVDKVIIIGWTI